MVSPEYGLLLLSRMCNKNVAMLVLVYSERTATSVKKMLKKHIPEV